MHIIKLYISATGTERYRYSPYQQAFKTQGEEKHTKTKIFEKTGVEKQT
jgi:hypothetical protein